ncbi:iron-containing alcohol dehydrogenase [Paracoccus sp. PS-1]|jgi:alcohol dehydrogenase class IV|uniref:iron-containing alcohol dehydrogenase n=1 Tax=Paracoccus TaxID=265 RepID=UPI001E576D14|nr:MULTISPECIES: iron-containing alcohol dehydrogenase [Paracoccus]MDF3907038.1 iron-containing alcohol dehydrogenase [Paracoccus sp. AS002]MDQ7263628.1 iron-containing alcohol dehydrogenase [Paracoccus sp. PS1]MDQ7776321.1 iron-containing alcohol dehydrogenase [Paracoccus aminovorans]UFS67337.1 iron-containing alcohol dehydrogenase [Paracoccus denitrificans]
MNPFVFNTTPSIVFRSGAADQIDRHVGALLGPRVLLVTDPGLRKLGLCDPAIAALRNAGHDLAIFDAVEPDPSVATVIAAVQAGIDARVTGVLGFGGGSSLDVAKVAALLLGSDQPLDEAWGVNNAQGPRLPLVLVPTTAGTGSEVTPVAILTVGGEEKRGVSSPVILPDIALLDAGLTLDLPPSITAATGVDAMVHAIEAYASASANNNPLSRMLAREALRLLGANIETAVADGADLAAREAMLLGSMLAGQAFANSPVAAVHALAYPVGGIFHIPHGLSNALVLPAVLRFNLPAAAATYAEIAADAFPQLADTPEDSRAEAFVDALKTLIGRLQMPPRLRDVNIPQDALPRMAADAMKQQRLLVNNPRPVTEADALAIYTEAW